MDKCSVVSATGSLGVTPFHLESFHEALKRAPNALAADAGSGDIGPAFLGADRPYAPVEWERRDISVLVKAAVELDIPLVIGSAGGAGTNSAVDRYASFVREALQECGGEVPVARIYSEVPVDYLRQRARQGHVRPLGHPDQLREDQISDSTRVVAMMGVEPIVDALRRGAKIVVAGRACDDAVFAAVPIYYGLDRALSLHMGKLIECASIVATPPLMRESIIGTVRQEDVIVSAVHPGQRCTPASVAGHSMYERPDPTELVIPGGKLDLRFVEFHQFSEQATLVRGARFISSDEYTVKLEGSEFIGERAYVLFGLRDPMSVARVDEILGYIEREARRVFVEEEGIDSYKIVFHVYGRNGVMGRLEPVKTHTSHELAVVAEIVAPTRHLVERLGGLVKYTALRAYYPGKLGTAGGAAFLQDEVWLSEMGAYRWTVDHILPLNHPAEVFRIEVDGVGAVAGVGTV